MRYRIISRPQILNRDYVKYAVQARMPYIPIWFRVTSYFGKSSQAEDYIDNILEERHNE